MTVEKFGKMWVLQIVSKYSNCPSWVNFKQAVEKQQEPRRPHTPAVLHTHTGLETITTLEHQADLKALNHGG